MTNAISTLQQRWHNLLYVDMQQVDRETVQSSLDRAQLDSFPFVAGSVALLTLLYALIQGLLFQEEGYGLMVVVALVSVLLLWGMQVAVQRGLVLARWADTLYVLLASVVLVNMMLRFYVTGQPRQSANLVLFMVAVGVLLLSTRWVMAMLLVTLAGWSLGVLLLPASPDWPFYVILLLTAAAAALILHLVRVRNYKQAVVMRMVQERQRKELKRLYEEVRSFNEQLETAVRERTLEVESANRQLARLNKTKSDFITIASHELRTPLTIINFNSQVLLDDADAGLDPLQHKYLSGIRRGVLRLEEIVESLLDVAKIDTRSLDLRPSPLKLPLLLRMLASHFQTTLEQRSLTLTIDLMADLPEVEADMEALQKVFYHLIENAIKYTPDGGHIEINGRVAPNRNGDMPQVEIVVADSGVGIDPEVHDLIFQKFYQTGEVMLHSSGKTNFKGGGAGLGLAIAKGIVEAHQGRVWVESPGYDETALPGSRFYLRLPLRIMKDEGFRNS
jgi:signal transduction histidine kinase